MDNFSFHPLHIAIIMDGNSRWAKQKNVASQEGHRQGAEAVNRTTRAAKELGVTHLTLFAFSSENWYRPEEEVRYLMELLEFYLDNKLGELQENKVKLKIIGDKTKLSQVITNKIEQAEKNTQANEELLLTIALSYGGRREIVHAVRQIQQKALGEVTEEMIREHLYFPTLPDPDILIRTGGEKRLSNFMLWQLAYTELFFLDQFWPDFDKEDLAKVLSEYKMRERRFGKR